MKKNESLVLQPEIKYILKPQASVNVVLNGGGYELDDATIPFQMGFSGNTAYKRPTHVLVVDVVRDSFSNDGIRKDSDTVSERTLLKLEPVNYLQLKKPGKHHLIFILFSGFPKWQYENLFTKRFSYETGLQFDKIEGKTLSYQVGYCEKVITVPEEFFAKKSETKLSKAIWYWVNSWHKLQPVDECEYRKRKISAFTIKPIIWLLGFMARFLIAFLVTTIQFCFRIIAFIFGYQPVRFFPHFKEVWWHFLFRYSQSMLKMDEIFDFADYWIGITYEEEYIKDADEEDFHKYKFHSILGKKFHSPLTIFGLIFYAVAAIAYTVLILSMFSFQANNFFESICASVFMAFIAFLASLMLVYNTLPTFFGDKHWKLKWDKSDINYKHLHAKAYSKSVGILLGLSLLAFIISALGRLMISQSVRRIDWTPPSFKETLLIILWALGMGLLILVGVYLVKYFISFVQKTKNKIKITANEAKKTEQIKHIQWLRSSFSLKNLPEKVDVTKAPEPSALVHRFVIKFWQTKAKVCRPYAKS